MPFNANYLSLYWNGPEGFDRKDKKYMISIDPVGNTSLNVAWPDVTWRMGKTREKQSSLMGLLIQNEST